MSDLPTPPAPGDRTGNGFDVAARALGFPAPGGREGLRAEDGTDPVAQDVARRLRAEMERLRESRDRWKAAHDARCDEVREAYEEGKRDGAALAARDTDQGAGALRTDLIQALRRWLDERGPSPQPEWLAKRLLDGPLARYADGGAARDTDQGARDALAEVRALADEALEMNSPPHATNSEVVWLVESIRAALARATPEGGEGK
jgi:hypothetical protein